MGTNEGYKKGKIGYHYYSLLTALILVNKKATTPWRTNPSRNTHPSDLSPTHPSVAAAADDDDDDDDDDDKG